MTAALLLLPTGTYRAEEYLDAAGSLGIEVVIGSEAPQALAHTMGVHFVELPLEDPLRTADAIVAHARRVHLDAVVAVDDTGAVGAAEAALRLGLRHNSPGSVALTRDKIAMRKAFAAKGVPQPRFEVAVSDAEVGAASARLGTPVVVKPAVLAGSRGVIRADSPKEAIAAASWARRILAASGEPADSPLLVEEFVAGHEVAVEAILADGGLDLIAVFDKPDPLDGPFFEETIYVAPSQLPDAVVAGVLDATLKAVAALGLTDGPVHAELRVNGPRVIEVASRTIGGRCSKALELEGGGTLEELVLARAVGTEGPTPRLAHPAGVLMIPIPRSGRLVGVQGVEEVRAIPNVTGVEITIPSGRQVKALPEGDRYLGFVFAAGGSARDVEEALRKAESLLRVEITAPATVT